MDTKKCSNCHRTEKIEEFTTTTATKDGYKTQCKRCVNEKSKIAYQRRKGILKKRSRERYAGKVGGIRSKKDPEVQRKKRNEYMKQYATDNQDKVKDYQIDYRLKNKEASRAYHKEYNKLHADRIRERTIVWREENRDRNNERERKRHAANKVEINKKAREAYNNPAEKQRRRDYYHDNKEHIYNVAREYRENSEKYMSHQPARNAVQRAYKNGKLTKPTICECCQQEKRLDAHHYKGYEKEHWLDVKFICRDCHAFVHRLHRLTTTPPINQ